MKAKKKKKPAKPVNWLTEKVSETLLNNIGFVTVKKNGVFTQRVPNTYQIDNINGNGCLEVYYYPPLDLVLVKDRKCPYNLALDSCLDSFWKGDLVTMKDIVAVMCLLSK